MKLKFLTLKNSLGPIFYCFALCHLDAQFVNLDFESANLPSLPPDQSGGLVPISQGLPGWRVFWGDTEQFVVVHNDWTLGSASVSIFGPQDPSIVEGRYTAMLQAGIDRMNPTGPFIEASVAQTGLVPSDALLLQFKMAPGPGPFQIGPFRVELDQQRIPVVPLLMHPNYTLFAGDVSAFAGTTAELRFIAETTRLPNNILLDSIAFVVPEPSTWALLGLGLLCFANHIRKRVRR